MKTLSLSEVKMKFSQFVEEVAETDNPLSVTRNGESVCVLMSQDVYDGWTETFEIMKDPKFHQTVLERVKHLNRGEGISLTAEELFGEQISSQKSPQPVRMKVLPDTKNELTMLNPETRNKVCSYVNKIARQEAAGTLLKEGLEGLAVFHIGQYSVIYRWRMHAIEVVTLDTRKTTYSI